MSPILTMGVQIIGFNLMNILGLLCYVERAISLYTGIYPPLLSADDYKVRLSRLKSPKSM